MWWLLGTQTTPPETAVVPPTLSRLLEDDDLGAAVVRGERGDRAGGAGADHQDVDLLSATACASGTTWRHQNRTCSTREPQARSSGTCCDPMVAVRTSSIVSTDPKDKDRNIFERIFDVAIQLAEEGGYDNVRQRDVAARAGVALGTLYKRFRSKEDILSAALDRETEKLERKLEKGPVKGEHRRGSPGGLLHRCSPARCAGARTSRARCCARWRRDSPRSRATWSRTRAA